MILIRSSALIFTFLHIYSTRSTNTERNSEIFGDLDYIKDDIVRKNTYKEFYTDHLKKLLRPRVPGTASHHVAKQFIISKLNEYGWYVELDEFIGETPLGKKPFTNIVAILDRNATKYVSLVAHYDTKAIPSRRGKQFVGATDSAVSCAMLLRFAQLFNESLERGHNIGIDASPMLIFTDGEESFVNWSDTDSLYGSRHLAEKMASQPHHNKELAAQGINVLESLDVFILLDLIGSGRGWFLDMHESTSTIYKKMKKIEISLKRENKIRRPYSYFYGKHDYEVEDDHIPFMERGVSILHLIVVPYPRVWHRLSDDESALNEGSIVDMLRIFEKFLIDHFEL